MTVSEIVTEGMGKNKRGEKMVKEIRAKLKASGLNPKDFSIRQRRDADGIEWFVVPVFGSTVTADAVNTVKQLKAIFPAKANFFWEVGGPGAIIRSV